MKQKRRPSRRRYGIALIVVFVMIGVYAKIQLDAFISKNICVNPADNYANDFHWANNVQFSVVDFKVLFKSGYPVSEYPQLEIAFSPDSKLLAVGEYNIQLWNTQTGESVKNFKPLDETMTSLAFRPNGQQIVSGAFDNKLRLWNVITGEQTNEFEFEHYVKKVQFSNDGQYLYILAQNLKRMDLTTHKIDRTFGGSSYFEDFALSTDEKCIVLAEQYYEGGPVYIGIVDAETGVGRWSQALADKVFFLPQSYAFIKDTGFTTWLLNTNSDPRRIAAIEDGYSVEMDRTRKLAAITKHEQQSIEIWNVTKSEKIAELTGCIRSSSNIAFSPDNHYLAMGRKDGGVCLWTIQVE